MKKQATDVFNSQVFSRSLSAIVLNSFEYFCLDFYSEDSLILDCHITIVLECSNANSYIKAATERGTQLCLFLLRIKDCCFFVCFQENATGALNLTWLAVTSHLFTYHQDKSLLKKCATYTDIFQENSQLHLFIPIFFKLLKYAYLC